MTSCRNCWIAPPTMGPRQMTGVPSGMKKAIEITLTPYATRGSILLFWARGSPRAPIIRGTFGPVISASSTPTRAPLSARARARLTETVVLPTPPLPEATAITLRTPGIPCLPCWPRPWTTRASILMLTARTPGRADTARRQSLSILPRSGQAGVVRTTVKLTTSPSIERFSIIPRETRSRPRSGSRTVLKARITSASVTACPAILSSPRAPSGESVSGIRDLGWARSGHQTGGVLAGHLDPKECLGVWDATRLPRLFGTLAHALLELFAIPHLTRVTAKRGNLPVNTAADVDPLGWGAGAPEVDLSHLVG